MTATQLTTATHRAPPALAGRVAGVARRTWRAYWDWRAREATVRILHSLDARTLRDIGLSPGEIESAVHGRPGERRRHYNASWRSCGGR